jgi:succinate dehydrogenase / fumarate reductase iron-sulfur subunit
MHPIDTADRREHLKDEGGIGFCNITKCCTEVCPEHIKITDNAIIPLKERVADKYYDPIQTVWRKLRGDRATEGSSIPPLPSSPADVD